jgi:6-pyruvoyl-tetrahydropterin synthase
MSWNVIKVNFIPTAENLAKWCYDVMQDKLPEGIEVTTCTVWETPTSCAIYHEIIAEG